MKKLVIFFAVIASLPLQSCIYELTPEEREEMGAGSSDRKKRIRISEMTEDAIQKEDAMAEEMASSEITESSPIE